MKSKARKKARKKGAKKGARREEKARGAKKRREARGAKIRLSRDWLSTVSKYAKAQVLLGSPGTHLQNFFLYF